MKIINDSSSLPTAIRTVLSVGNFDGVHKGHEQLITIVKQRSAYLNAASAIVTFEPHTREIINETITIQRLTTFEEKAILVEKAGIDYLICIPFTKDLAALSPDLFLSTILIGRFNAIEWVMGSNHTFGKNKQGDNKFLHTGSGINHFSVFSVDLLTEHAAVTSSTTIRSLLGEHRIEEAVDLLGHPYLIVAQRAKGIGKGSEMGYPTMNFVGTAGNKVVPPAGIYAAELEFRGSLIKGALYFGDCPTFGNRDLHFEFYAIEPFSVEPMVQEKTALWLHSFIRNDEKFSSQAQLTTQIQKDIINIKNYFFKGV